MFTGLESPAHLMILLIIFLLLFGPKRLPELGRSLGSGIRAFKHSLTEETADSFRSVDAAALPSPVPETDERGTEGTTVHGPVPS